MQIFVESMWLVPPSNNVSYNLQALVLLFNLDTSKVDCEVRKFIS